MKIYDEFTGVVKDNNDPDKLGKLQIDVPDIADVPIWVEPSSFPSSSSGGLFLLPDVGDTVRIKCEHGDSSYPVWEFGFWLEGNLMPEASANYPESLVLKFGDNCIELDKANSKITLTNGDMLVTMVDGKIQLNEGKNKGIPLVEALVATLNHHAEKINALNQEAKTHIHPHPQGPTTQSTSASSLQDADTTSVSDLGNPEIEQ